MIFSMISRFQGVELSPIGSSGATSLRTARMAAISDLAENPGIGGRV
jgi:hypothetical protein